MAGIFIFRKINPQRVLAGAFTSTAIFFLVSNVGGWIGSRFYSQDFGGWMTFYVAGIRFLKGTLFGDLFYSGVLFGSLALAQKQFPVLRINLCQCTTVTLNETEQAYIREQFNDCLCASCLLALKKQYKQKQFEARINRAYTVFNLKFPYDYE